MSHQNNLRASVGMEPTTGLYYEVLGQGERFNTPILFIHGGGGSGILWRYTMEQKPGWADLLVDKGYQCWVTDWPGMGRSAYRDFESFEYEDAVEGYVRLLVDIIQEPVVIVPHSMGGAITWRLLELVPELVAGVVPVAAAYPANLQKNGEVVSDDGRFVEAVFADTGLTFKVDRERPYVYSEEYMRVQAGGDGPHIVKEVAEAELKFPSALPPRMLLQRIGVLEGMPAIKNTEGFAGKTIRLISGDHDKAHTIEIEMRTVELLRSWGADADLVWLPDRGLHGHSHWLMRERNYEKVLDILEEQLRLIIQ